MWIRLDYRAVVQLEGADVDQFLQGLITQNMLSLKIPSYGLMLTSKGRYAFDFFILRKNGKVWLTPGLKDMDTFIAKLSLYRLQSDVTITPLNDHCVAVSTTKLDTVSEGGLIFQDPRHSDMGSVYVGLKEGMSFSEDVSVYDSQRLKYTIPEGPLDFEPGKTIPLEAGMDRLNAIDFEKGCYLGQEFTSRTKHLGVIRKQFSVVYADHDFCVGDKILSNEKEVGTIKSVYGGTRGFALLRCDDVGVLTLNGQPLFRA